jgi:lipopolysaccharide transport system ATP-binding protein
VSAHSSSDLAVVLSDVSVRYRMPTERINSLKEQVIRRLTGHGVQFNEFWALRDINLRVRHGEAVGLIGSNGAGKSTLLKVIARVQKPSSGRVWVQGVISPMIELGAGFHTELTGRENIFLNGAMLGFSKREMMQKFDSIVEFSELGSFIDTPIRTYSSGMLARLGFSIAVSADPDILIIDEALSVGDEAFQKKCIARMNEFLQRGVTVFYVTHALDTISTLCPHAVWLDGGQIRCAGPTEEVIETYRLGLESEIDISLLETRKLQLEQIRKAN